MFYSYGIRIVVKNMFMLNCLNKNIFKLNIPIIKLTERHYFVPSEIRFTFYNLQITKLFHFNKSQL